MEVLESGYFLAVVNVDVNDIKEDILKYSNKHDCNYIYVINFDTSIYEVYWETGVTGIIKSHKRKYDIYSLPEEFVKGGRVGTVDDIWRYGITEDGVSGKQRKVVCTPLK